MEGKKPKDGANAYILDKDLGDRGIPAIKEMPTSKAEAFVKKWPHRFSIVELEKVEEKEAPRTATNKEPENIEKAQSEPEKTGVPNTLTEQKEPTKKRRPRTNERSRKPR